MYADNNTLFWIVYAFMYPNDFYRLLQNAEKSETINIKAIQGLFKGLISTTFFQLLKEYSETQNVNITRLEKVFYLRAAPCWIKALMQWYSMIHEVILYSVGTDWDDDSNFPVGYLIEWDMCKYCVNKQFGNDIYGREFCSANPGKKSWESPCFNCPISSIKLAYKHSHLPPKAGKAPAGATTPTSEVAAKPSAVQPATTAPAASSFARVNEDWDTPDGGYYCQPPVVPSPVKMSYRWDVSDKDCTQPPAAPVSPQDQPPVHSPTGYYPVTPNPFAPPHAN